MSSYAPLTGSERLAILSGYKDGRRTGMSNDPFIDSAALSSLGPVRYLDARDRAAFDAGHAPNAVRAPVDAWDKAIKKR